MNRLHALSIDATTAALLPLLVVQGARLMRRTPDVEEAAGARHGVIRDPGSSKTRASLQGPERPLSILVVGESTAVGVGAPIQSEGLAGFLARGLATQAQRSVRWRVVGRSGFTARQVQSVLLPALTPHQPETRIDLAVVVLGVNDTKGLTRHRAWSRQVRAVVRGVQERTHARLVLCTGVPRFSDFDALPRPLRDVLDARSRMLDQALGETLTDIKGAMHAPFSAPISPALLCHDRFHPGPAGYEAWAGHLLDVAGRSIGT